MIKYSPSLNNSIVMSCTIIRLLPDVSNASHLSDGHPFKHVFLWHLSFDFFLMHSYFRNSLLFLENRFEIYVFFTQSCYFWKQIFCCCSTEKEGSGSFSAVQRTFRVSLKQNEVRRGKESVCVTERTAGNKRGP